MLTHFLTPKTRQMFNRSFNVATAVNFLVMVSYYQLFVTTTIFARDTLGASLSVAGSATGLMVIGVLIGRFVTGNLISSIGAKKVLILGTLAYFILLALDHEITSMPVFIAQRLIGGMALGMTTTATGTIVAFSLPFEIQGLGVSVFSLSTAVALALGPFIGLTVVQLAGFAALDIELGVLSVLALIIALCLGRPPEVKAKRRPLLKLSSYIDIRVVKFATVATMMTFGYGCVAAYLAAMGAERSIEGGASIFFLVSAGFTIFTRPLTGRLFDKYGENLVVYPCIACVAIAMLIITVADSTWMLIVAGIFQGLGFGNFQSAGQALSLHLVRKYRFPQATSTFFIFFDLGIGVGPYIFGLIATHYGFTAMFLALAIVSALILPWYYIVHGRNHPLKRPLRRMPGAGSL